MSAQGILFRDDTAAREFADEFAPERKKPTSIPPKQAKRHADEALAFAKSGDWSQATPAHFVALYASMHRRVYGVDADLTGKTRLYAAGAAGRMLRVEFGDDPAEMASFLRWTWQREIKREKRRRDQLGEASSYRITWRLQFGLPLLADYRLERLRAKR